MSREMATVVEAFRAAGRPIPAHLVDDEPARIRSDIEARHQRLRTRASELRVWLRAR